MDHDCGATGAGGDGGGRGHSKKDDALLQSSPGLWLPRTVVKADRTKATVIWVSLLVMFGTYVAFIVWETVKSRKNPAASIEIKQEHFKFPDLAICVEYGSGCLTDGDICLHEDLSAFSLFSQSGFEEDDFSTIDRTRSLEAQDAYPHCRVFPSSQLTVNETGVDNGDITSFRLTFYAFWAEDLFETYEVEDDGDIRFNSQSVDLYFIDLDKSLDAIGHKTVDAKLPYERVNMTTNEWFTSMHNHLISRNAAIDPQVISMTEFTAISADGSKGMPERTYAQSTTSAKENWWWTGDNAVAIQAFLTFDLTIGKFEFTSIEEVDPVDPWTMIGAIGGVWQFVVIGFGLFFVFSEAQKPTRKIRDFRETATAPVKTFFRRLSSLSMRSSTEHGSIGSGGTGRDKPAYGGGTDRGDQVPYPVVHNLPPNWERRVDDDGRPFYANCVTRATQWEVPRN